MFDSLRANKIVLALCDALIVNVTVWLGLMLRFDGTIRDPYFHSFLLLAAPRAVVALVVFHFGGLYRSLWRYASIEEFFGVMRTVSLYALGFGLLVALRLTPPFPRSVALLTWVLDVVGVAGIRLLVRVIRRAVVGSRGGSIPERRRVLIAGAGAAGAMVARELLQHEELRSWPVGFVDDDPAKQRMRISGIEVIGTTDMLVDLISKHRIDQVIVAMPSAPPEVLRRIMSLCHRLVTIRIVPGLYELVDGKVTLSQIRPVRLEDLLGRAPVSLEVDQIAGYLQGETVLVTGAGGSIGSELCRQIGRFAPGALILLGNEENSIFELSLELGFMYPALRVVPVIANIRDRSRMAAVYAEYRPDVVFHAAAHKHVPLMEAHPDEAIKNNVSGTRIVAELAREHGVKRFVLISSDKAVNPTSVMGASKRVAELILQHLSGGPTKFISVRFGNVLGSRGSVVPIFQEQIARGGPVTVTHPDMVRFFMTIPEAAQLVIQAGAYGQGGEVYVLDMGHPIRIMDLAQNLIRLSGLEPEVDIPIVLTGIRPGEKLYEEILTAEEGTRSTRHSRIFVANISQNLPANRFLALLDALEESAAAGDRAAILRNLRELVPTYCPQDLTRWVQDEVAATRQVAQLSES